MLVTLAEKNPQLVEEKLYLIKSELGSDDIFEEQKAGDVSPQKVSRTKFHNLIRSIADNNKIDRLFNQISGLNIERVWREQKEIVLLEQIYVAATTYGGDTDACIYGTYHHIVNSTSEIDSKLMDQYAEHLDKENEQEKQKDSITEKNIIQFVENLAEKLIQYVEDNPELKEVLLLHVLHIEPIDINNPKSTTIKQQRILAKINQEFSKSIKGYLCNYNSDIPKIDEYNIIIGQLSQVKSMTGLALTLDEPQSGEALSKPEIEQPQPGLIVKEVNQAEEIQLNPEIKQPQQVPVVEEVQPEPGVQEHTEEEELHKEQDPQGSIARKVPNEQEILDDFTFLDEADEETDTENKAQSASGQPRQNPLVEEGNLSPTVFASAEHPRKSPQQTSTKKRFMYGMMIASPFLAVGIYSGLAGAVAFNPILAIGIFIGIAVAALASFVIMKASEEKEKDPEMTALAAIKTVLKNIFTFQCERDDGIKV